MKTLEQYYEEANEFYIKNDNETSVADICTQLILLDVLQALGEKKQVTGWEAINAAAIEAAKCPLCEGGIRRGMFGQNDGYCDCHMGRDLRKVEAREKESA